MSIRNEEILLSRCKYKIHIIQYIFCKWVYSTEFLRGAKHDWVLLTRLQRWILDCIFLKRRARKFISTEI